MTTRVLDCLGEVIVFCTAIFLFPFWLIGSAIWWVFVVIAIALRFISDLILDTELEPSDPERELVEDYLNTKRQMREAVRRAGAA